MSDDIKKWILISKEKIEEALSNEPVQGCRALEPLKSFSKINDLPFIVLEDSDVDNEAEVHKTKGDLFHCLEGEVVFVCGGELIDPWEKKKEDGSLDENELGAKQIRNGTELILKTGDWLWIPSGQPHQHKCSGTARLLVVKIPSKI